MITRIISLIMSFVISITGFLYTSFNNIIDSVSEMIFGIPYTAEAVKADFFSEIDNTDIVAVYESTGFVSDLAAVFIDGDLSFTEKLALFGTTGGVISGWSSVVDLYIIRYPVMDYDTLIKRCEKLNQTKGVVFAMPVTTSKMSADYTPDDPFDDYDFSYPEWDELNPEGSNWWLEAIDARQAWDYSEYFNRIDIGIVESGVDGDHPDLEGKIFFPSQKQADRNYPDYHGCHVAGIIGANHNNKTGIAGVCDNSRIICVDWLPETDALQLWSTELAIFFGFSELVKSGAKVVNLSLGNSSSKEGNSNGFFDEYILSCALSIMMSSLLSKGYDFVAVQSAGNGDMNGEPVNANCNGHFSTLHKGNILTVGGVTADDILDRIIVVASAENLGDGKYIQAAYTNVGKTVSIAAPGSDIYSCSTYGDYEYLSGTSMAAPVVTGVASLVWSVNPDFTGAQVKEIVCSSTDSVAVINRYYDYYYDVDLIDYPMVNAKLAVEKAICLTDETVGTVSGRIIGENASEIVYNGKSHVLFSDGTYSFVAPSSSGSVQVFDNSGNEIGSFEIVIEAGKETVAGEYVISDDFEEIPQPLV